MLEAASHIEDMVLSFLSQLAFSGQNSHSEGTDSGSDGGVESEDAHTNESGRKHPRKKEKITLRLADRAKVGNAG